ncbi:hypothetical protein OJM15_gp47 [uncultured phage cr16_1]|uniref:hypothetical protein n=1 Tax=uncultured phage cr16_1 TaxID=2986414 RepID=UPI001C7493FD|nr:hypothetical protein OJM15_gp47 [uncultured phage cr16_1]
MKTILYNPIFINPLAYYVFPRLTRYLQPDNESTSEPANYIGTIEVKVIAYGDTTLKRTYTNTDSIDLSEFKNTWINVSLFTKVGSCVLGEWKIGNVESDLPYIDPEVLASLKAVVIVGNKTNNDSDRAIVKNLVDPDNPFVISNAAYTEGSGYADKGSPYYGAFVTDGIDDLITSTKTVQEMGITDEVTVVSMIHQIDLNSTYTIATTNYIENSNSREHVRSDVYNYGKTGIYGYSASLINNTKSDIKNILGDEADYYVKSTNSLQTIFDAKFSVVGRISELIEASQVAWYWTIIANKVLTTDQINQVIAYFNLDRTLKPDILCNTIKQGITNENHAEFGDKLIDFSGNGRDIQLNNIAWKGDSGIGKYNFSNINIIANRFEGTVTTNKCHFTKKLINTTSNFCDLIVISPNEPIKFKVSGLSDGRKFFVANKSGSGSNYYFDNGEHEVSLSFSEGVGQNNPFGVTGDIGDIDVTVEFIPSHAGALCLDGVNDFGKVTGMPIYKDYTIVVDYERISGREEALISKAYIVNQGAFVLMETSGTAKHSYSFGAYTAFNRDDFTRTLLYQSKYKCGDVNLTIGKGIDGDTLWLGTLRNNDYRFFNGAIYSLMTFPYSMSEFLIERQLKKHKLGTLYPDMVEFRPVIKSNVLLDAKPTFVIRGTSTYLNAGDYVPENSQIWVSIKMNNIADRITKFTVNGKTIDIPKNAYSEVTLQYVFPFVIDKSPQKITMTIEQDENYVKFEPVITSNVEYVRLDFYLNNYEKRINIGDYIPKDAYIRANFYLKNNVDELTVFTFNGVNIDYRRSSVDDTAFNIGSIYNYNFPQEVNITIDEYIRFEDIVQPYPVLLRFKDENGNKVSWGGKFKVGSTITRIGSAADSNLLPNIYNIFGLLLNDNQVTSSKVIVEKTMVFKAKSAYIFDNNEPKCILSPRLLRIPNSSYKILGYIPDISGHGNHGKINNSAYKLNSGVNGYLVDFTTLKDDGIKGIVRTDSKIYLDKSFNYNQGFWLGRTNNPSPAYKVKVSGIPETGMLTYTGGVWLNLVNGINELPARTNTEEEHGFVIQSPNLDWSNLVIEQIGEYEGAYCFDGVDDFVTIPTTVGGKQVLMKVNWQKEDTMIYNQNPGEDNFAIYANDYNNNNLVNAYASRNNGSTYIDGILNNNILATQLKDVTHNITITNENVIDNTIIPVIGANAAHNNFYAQMSLYDFMLFDEISTEAKIKELNEYVGIEAKVELPPYYWDAYGKTNLDGDKATIQQRGVAVGDYDLTNTNFAYDKMSGFGGYTLGKFTNSWSLSNNNNSISIVARNPYDITLKKLGENSDWEFNTTELKIISNPVSVKFKSDKNIRFTCDYHYYTVGGNSEGAPLGITSKDLIANEDTIITISPISQENIDKYNIDINRGYYLIYFQLSLTLAVNEEVTIEMLPLYPNGLVYDGVEDYSKNENIPVLTDYTIIAKRLWINKDNPLNEQFIHKGAINTPIRESAFMLEYEIANDTYYRSSSYGGYINIERSNRPERIVYQTSNSYNGTSITKGSGTDTTGIVIGGVTNNYWNGVFYKLMLYSKTLPLLQINYLKNLMERDEIIDLNNPIFIQE